MTTAAKWKWATAVMVILGLLVAGRELPLLDWMGAAADSIRSLGVWGVILYAFCFAVAAMLCIPCMPLTIAGGFIFGTAVGLAAVHGGTALAAAGGFLVGRYAGRAHVAEWLRRSERFRFLDAVIAHEDWKIIGLLRLLPIPLGPSNYLYGMTGAKFRHYFLATIVAMLPGNAIFAHLGSAGGRNFGEGSGVQPLEWIALGLGIASLATLGMLLPKYLRKHRGLKPSAPVDGPSPQADGDETAAAQTARE